MPMIAEAALLLAAAVAAPSPSALTTPYANRSLPDGERVAPEELRRYAEALIEVRQVRKSLGEALQKAPAAAAPMLRQQATAVIAERLRHHGIDQMRFNQITAQIGRDAALRRTVRQFVMQEQMGI